MANWREQKHVARKIVHETMGIDGRYFSDRGAAWTPVLVRLQTKWGLIGDPHGQGWAEQQAVKPRLVFMRADQEPQNGAVIWLAEGEAYRVDNVLPPDDITRTAEVVRLTVRQYAEEGFPT